MQSRFCSTLVAKITMKPSQVLEYVTQFSGVNLSVELLNGIVHITGPEPIDLPSFGAVIVQRAPTAWKTPERVFGPPTPAWQLMRHIKRTLDPDDVFNPGRMFS